MKITMKKSRFIPMVDVRLLTHYATPYSPRALPVELKGIAV